MNWSPFNILVGVAGILAVVSLIRPTWPLLGVSVILLCTALLVGRG